MLAHDYILEMGHEVELSLTREEDSHHPQDPNSDRPVDQEPHQQLQQDSGQHPEIEGSLLCLADFRLVILVTVLVLDCSTQSFTNWLKTDRLS